VKSSKAMARVSRSAAPDIPELLEKYGCGPIKFTGSDDALYERHLMFDSGVAKTFPAGSCPP